jgi:hypothetical protein
VVDVQHDDFVIADGEDDAIFVLPLAVKQFAEFLGKLVALGRSRAALRLAGQRLRLLE